MAADAKIIEKIQKLLALGTSPNEHEAAAALAKAQSLMEEYDLSMMDLEHRKADDGSILETDGEVYSVQGKPEAWREKVAKAVAKTSDCWVLSKGQKPVVNPKTGKTSWGEAHYLIGRKRDVELATYGIDFMLRELQRLADMYTKIRWMEIWEYADKNGLTHQVAESRWVTWYDHKHPLTAKKWWLEGAADGVVTMLENAKYERTRASANSSALVEMKGAAIRDWFYMKQYGMTYDAYVADRKAKADAWAKAHPSAVSAEPKPMTDAQRRAQAERDARAQERANRAYWREQDKKARAMDHDAYGSGYETGRKMDVRPGVGGGAAGGAARIDR